MKAVLASSAERAERLRSTHRLVQIACLLVGATAACTTGQVSFEEGTLSGPGGRRTTDGPGGDGDDPNNPNNPNNPMADRNCAEEDRLQAPQLRRLTPVQYRNTLQAAFDGALSNKDFPDFHDDYPMVGLANDPDRLRISVVSIDSIYDAARSTAATVSAGHPPVADCVAANDETCFETLIDEVGEALWRRPVDPDERADLAMGLQTVRDADGTRAQQMEFLISALLMSPNTLYRTEVGSGAGDMTQLTSYEIASLLSYALTDGPPDDTLRGLAESDALRDPDVLAEQTRRLIDDKAFVSSVVGFYRDFLKLDGVQTVEKDEHFGLTAAARAALADSAAATLRSQLSGSGAGFMDVFVGQTFEVNAEAASFFGADVSGDAMQPVALPADEREGILTHPAFLATHAGRGNTGIVRRGVFTLRQLLGEKLPDPPPDVTGVPEDELPDFDPETTSTREQLRIEHSGQDRCINCHKIIDPAGFGFESFDPVGRFRTVEKQDVPIDASGEVGAGTETLTFDDSIEYMQALAASEAMRRSVLHGYFEFVMGRPGSDCELEKFDAAVSSAEDTLVSLAENIVLTDSFAARDPEADMAGGEETEQ